MEYWDLMDGGEYVYNTLCPTPYIAWEKQQMGWPVDVQTLTTSGSYTMATSNEQGGTVYKIVNDDDPTQYFLLENIIKTGWNSHLPSPGLMVYRVIYNGEAIQADYRFNNIAGKPRLAIVPADGVCLSSYIDANANYYRESLRHDLFPGNPAVTALNDDMALPNFAFYTNYTAGTTKKVNKALSNIAQSAEGVITFDFVANNTAGIDGIIDNTTATHQPIYTLDGRYVGTSTTALPRGVYVRGGKKFVK
jgi:immune inhibitor A